MIAVVFIIDEPLDKSTIEPIIETIASEANRELGKITRIRGYIAVDKAADEVTSIFERPVNNEGSTGAA